MHRSFACMYGTGVLRIRQCIAARAGAKSPIKFRNHCQNVITGLLSQSKSDDVDSFASMEEDTDLLTPHHVPIDGP